MTVTTTKARSGPYAGDGVQTSFPYDFLTYDAAFLQVYLTVLGVDTLLTLGVDYTVTGVGEEQGGTVETVVAPVIGETLTIIRVVPELQETRYSNQGGWFPEVHERGFDELTMMVQQNSLLRELSIRAPLTDPLSTTYELPPVKDRAQTGETYQYITFDSNGNVIVNTGQPGPKGDPGDLTAVEDDDNAGLGSNLRMNGKSLVSSAGGQPGGPLLAFTENTQAEDASHVNIANGPSTGPAAISVGSGQANAGLWLEAKGDENVYAREPADGARYPIITAYNHAVGFGCELIYVNATTLRLDPVVPNGGVWIQGVYYRLPYPGPTLPTTGIGATTLVQVYASDDGAGNVVLSRDSVQWDWNTSYSHPTKSGDAAYTPVGAVYTNGAGEFEIGGANRWVRSLWNERPFQLKYDNTTTPTLSPNGNWVAIPNVAINLLLLPSEQIAIGLHGPLTQEVASNSYEFTIARDGGVGNGGTSSTVTQANLVNPYSMTKTFGQGAFTQMSTFQGYMKGPGTASSFGNTGTNTARGAIGLLNIWTPPKGL